MIDDSAATKVARTHGLEVHGSLWLIAGFSVTGKMTEHAASNLIDALRDVGRAPPLHRFRIPGLGSTASSAAAY